MASPHARAVQLALVANDQLGALFDELGSADDERGIYGVYALYVALLEQLFDVPVRAVSVLGQMEAAIERELNDVMFMAAVHGSTLALSLLATHDIPQAFGAGSVGVPIRAAALDALMSIVRAQLATVRSAVLYNVFDKATVLGDGERVGVLAPGPVVRESARWIAATSSAVQVQVIEQGLGEQRNEWGLQAVAAIDERTTECCLKVHGQVAPLGEKFHLTGEPHYAEYMDGPPYHFWCRTSTALVKLDTFDDALTANMIEAAFDEFTARKQRSAERVRVPSSATSRRG